MWCYDAIIVVTGRLIQQTVIKSVFINNRKQPPIVSSIQSRSVILQLRPLAGLMTLCTHMLTHTRRPGRRSTGEVCVFSVLITICNETLKEINKTKIRNKASKNLDSSSEKRREHTHSPSFFSFQDFDNGKSKGNCSESFLNLKSISKASLPFHFKDKCHPSQRDWRMTVM